MAKFEACACGTMMVETLVFAGGDSNLARTADFGGVVDEFFLFAKYMTMAVTAPTTAKIMAIKNGLRDAV